MKKLCSIVLMLSVISCFAAPDLSKILAGQIDLILEFIATIIPKDLVIVEDGAFDGKKTKMMSELWPQGTIHLFESLSSSFAKLEKTTKDCANVFRYKCALSTKTGMANFYEGSSNVAAFSLLAPTKLLQRCIRFHQTPRTVTTITLDEWAE